MLNTRILNKTITTVLILLLTVSILGVIKINIFKMPAVYGINIPTGSATYFYVNTTHWSNTGIHASATPLLHALGNATTGTTINVMPGQYNGTYIISTAGLYLVSNQSASNTVIDAYNLTITASDVTVSGFTFISTAGDHHVIVIDSSSSVLDNITITNSVLNLTRTTSTIGISIGEQTTNSKVSNVTMSYNTFNGPADKIANPWKIGGSFGNPIGCEVETLKFEHNTVYSCSIPINLHDKNITDILINSNTFRNTDGVVYVWETADSPTGKLSYFVFTNNDVDSTNTYGVGIDTNNKFTDANFGDGNRINYNSFVGIPGGYGFHAVSILSSLTTYELNATLNWWGDSTGPGGAGSGNGCFVSSNVDYDPWLGMYTKQITPTLVKGSLSYWFNITVKNTGSIPPIGSIKITYPSGFTYNAYSPPAHWYKSTQIDRTLTFQAVSGQELSLSSEVTFRLNLTTPSASGNYSWTVLCQNANNEKGALPPLLQVQVDSTKPTITITHPNVGETYYSAGSENYMWLNLTVTDDVNKSPIVVLNDTRFVLHSPPTVTGTYEFKFCYRNNTAIPDGALAIQINATDYLGNKATVYPKVAETTVDNTFPIIYIDVWKDTSMTDELSLLSGRYYMDNVTTTIYINVTVLDNALDSAFTSIYINTTHKVAESGTLSSALYVEWSEDVTNIDYLVVNVTATDMAKPSNNTSELKQIVQRDIEGPYEVGFTEAEAVRGGLVIRGLYALDPAGVDYYDVIVNGTHLTNIHEEKLISTTLTDEFTFNGAIWLNLTDYAGKFVNITTKAYDLDSNPSYEIVVYTGVIPEGRSYPIELWPGWNLISSPLVIAPYTEVESFLSTTITGTDYTDIVEIMWDYDPSTSPSWYKFIPGFVDEIGYVDDGRGYWIETKTGKHDVLIVQGWSCPAPPDVEPSPPVYSVTELWNTMGYTSITPGLDATYLAGIDNKYLQILGWNASIQEWITVFLIDAWTANLEPGNGYWIYMQAEGHIVPPPYA